MKTDMTIMLWHQMQLGLDPENEYPDNDVQVLSLDIDGSHHVVNFSSSYSVSGYTTLKDVFFNQAGKIIDVVAWSHIHGPLF